MQKNGYKNEEEFAAILPRFGIVAFSGKNHRLERWNKKSSDKRNLTMIVLLLYVIKASF